MSETKNYVTIGADPEGFLLSPERGIISSEGIVKGSKGNGNPISNFLDLMKDNKEIDKQNIFVRSLSKRLLKTDFSEQLRKANQTIQKYETAIDNNAPIRFSTEDHASDVRWYYFLYHNYHLFSKEPMISALEDNVMVELNVPYLRLDRYNHHSDYKILFLIMLNAAKQKLQKKINYHIDFSTPEFRLSNNELNTKQAKTIGCAQDYDAYSEEPSAPRIAPKITEFDNYRFTGGHIHIGFDKPVKVPPFAIARLMDLIYCQYMLIDKQFLRRNYYGKPGLYRPVHNGIEYRTPSSFWLTRGYKSAFLDDIMAMANSIMDSPESVNKIYQETDWGKMKELFDSLNKFENTYDNLNKIYKSLIAPLINVRNVLQRQNADHGVYDDFVFRNNLIRP